MEGLIHRARLLVRTRGARNAQGEYPVGEGVPGPWFAARLMERGAVAPERRRRTNGTDATVARGYELLTDTVDEAGAPVVLTASALVQTECALLGSPTLELDGEPEKLNDGEEHIGYMCFATKAKDRA